MSFVTPTARFVDKVALVTAAGAGIGSAVAARLAAEGAAVVVSDVDDAAGAGVVDTITATGGRAVYQHADVGEPPADVAGLVARAVEEFGGLHLAVNNAGVGTRPIRVHEMPDDAWARTESITLDGTFQCLKAEIAHMVAHDGGAIVNTASIAGLKASPGLTPYSAAKAGVVSLTHATALEYVTNGIRVNAVAPGAIETAALASLPAEAREGYANDVPMKRLGQPEEIAAATAFLLSDEAAFITGVVLPVDGGTPDRMTDASAGSPGAAHRPSELRDVLVRVVAQWSSGAMMGAVASREGLDLDTSEIVVLTVAWRHGPLRPSTIAQHLSTGASNISKILRRLETRELVERRVDPDDARASRIWLTPAGEDVGQRLVRGGDHLVDELLAGWSDDDRRDFVRLLGRFEASTASFIDR